MDQQSVFVTLSYLKWIKNDLRVLQHPNSQWLQYILYSGCRHFSNRLIEINKMMSMIAANTAPPHLMKNPKKKFLFVMEFNSLRFWFEIHIWGMRTIILGTFHANKIQIWDSRLNFRVEFGTEICFDLEARQWNSVRGTVDTVFPISFGSLSLRVTDSVWQTLL